MFTHSDPFMLFSYTRYPLLPTGTDKTQELETPKGSKRKLKKKVCMRSGCGFTIVVRNHLKWKLPAKTIHNSWIIRFCHLFFSFRPPNLFSSVLWPSMWALVRTWTVVTTTLWKALRHNPSTFFSFFFLTSRTLCVCLKLCPQPNFCRLGHRRKKKSVTLSENGENSPTNKRARRSKSFDDDENVMMLPLQLPGPELYTQYSGLIVTVRSNVLIFICLTGDSQHGSASDQDTSFASSSSFFSVSSPSQTTPSSRFDV